MGRSLFSGADIPVLEYNHSRATVFGVSWSRFFALKSIVPSDIWAPDVEVKCLMTARLFPLAECPSTWRDLLWVQELDGVLSPSRLESWRNRRRFSIQDFLHLYHPMTALRNLRATTTSAILRAIPRWPLSFAPYLRRACAGINLK